MAWCLRVILFLVVLRCMEGKPLQPTVNVSLDINSEILKTVNENSKGSKRTNRQNVEILDPGDFEQTYEIDGNDIELMDPPKVAPPPQRAPVGSAAFVGRLLSSSSAGSAKNLEGSGRGGIAGIITGVLGSSSKGSASLSIISNITRSINVTLTKQKQKESYESPEDDDDDAPEEAEPPGGGDGQGGGILGLLAGLSGEGGQSDLGTLLSTIASIVGNLSGGEGFDLNAVIGAGVALVAGILAGDGMQHIGTQIGTYVNTAFSGITGGGAFNNGQFLGDLLATVISGSSMAGTGDSNESGGGGGSDSGTFFLSLISSLFGGSSRSN